MCGIIGGWATRGGNVSGLQDRISKSLKLLTHRGPDDQGVWVDQRAGVVLGHRRLSIIDLTSSGHQPMLSRNGRFCLTYNGEIYNFLEIRDYLLAKGIILKGTSDTETLLELFATEGPEALQRLRGMFAMAIWDREEKQLFLARDRVGKKPLYYYMSSGRELIFSSELNALAMLAGIHQFTVNLSAVDTFLSDGVIGGTQTIYKDVFKLLPGHFAYIEENGQVSTHRYWRIDWAKKKDISFDEAVEKTEFLLQRAVNERLRADVPVGVFLSGGIDSGLITAYAARNCNKPIKTISIGFQNGAFDERSLAKQVSEKYGTDHEEYVIEPDILSQLPSIISSYGEPFGDASAIPSYFVSKVAAKHVKVVLNGDGGDELFQGYRRHIASRIFARLEGIIPGMFIQGAGKIGSNILPVPKSYRSRYAFLCRMLRVAAKTGWQRYLVLASDGYSAEEKKKLYSESLVESECGPSSSMQHLQRLMKFDTFNATIACDFEFSLPDALLVKMDIASMANSLEARSPFLDHNLAEFAFSIPQNIKLPEFFQTKPILRSLAAKYLPWEVVNAPKRGFEIPLVQWMQGELQEMRDDFILGRSGIASELFNRSYLESLLHGKEKMNMELSRWAQLVWFIMVLAIWDHQREGVLAAGCRES